MPPDRHLPHLPAIFGELHAGSHRRLIASDKPDPLAILFCRDGTAPAAVRGSVNLGARGFPPAAAASPAPAPPESSGSYRAAGGGLQGCPAGATSSVHFLEEPGAPAEAHRRGSDNRGSVDFARGLSSGGAQPSAGCGALPAGSGLGRTAGSRPRWSSEPHRRDHGRGQQVRIRVAYLDREVRRIAVAPSWSPGLVSRSPPPGPRSGTAPPSEPPGRAATGAGAELQAAPSRPRG